VGESEGSIFGLNMPFGLGRSQIAFLHHAKLNVGLIFNSGCLHSDFGACWHIVPNANADKSTGVRRGTLVFMNTRVDVVLTGRRSAALKKKKQVGHIRSGTP